MRNPSMAEHELIAENARLERRILELEQSGRDHQRVSAAQAYLAATSSGARIEPFFSVLARYLAQDLGMDFVCIDRLEGDGLTARTVAVWCDDHFEDNVTYALKDTPCGDVVGKTVCCFPASVCQFFPRDQVLQDLRAECHVGVTLFGHTGQPIGLIAVIGRGPLANRSLAEATLKMVAVRGAAEMERQEAEEEREKLQAQLLQVQKMDLVGRLAGGVAHDFNNMLGVILGYADLALYKVEPSHPIHADLIEIRKAASRSADLTRQLLAFARKQTIVPRVLNLNETIGGMLDMLQRLIGEHIQLRWRPDADLWRVRADPSQIDQILTTLCVNARDAIASVGHVTVQTENRTFDDVYSAAHAGVASGDYVRIIVSDDGCGMEQETLSHIFEPFFTTKGVGEGTGLGLASVYGVVKQNGGFIRAHSDPGVGTTFTMCLPRHAEKGQQPGATDQADRALRGHETILLVEDEPSLLALTARRLERQGYRVLTAGTPGDAIRLAGAHPSEIHLLITDVVVPEMNGRTVATHVRSLHPHLACLFMSGYTADVIAEHGVVEAGLRFLQKPFSIRELGAAVREALG